MCRRRGAGDGRDVQIWELTERRLRDPLILDYSHGQPCVRVAARTEVSFRR